MPVTTFPLGPWETNSHVLHRDGRAVIVDVGDDPSAVVTFLQQNQLTLSHILITHLHCDHLYGVAKLHEVTGAAVLAPEGDAALRGTPDAEGGDGWPLVEPFASEPLVPGEQTLGGFDLRVFPTPGHTRGSVSLYCPEEHAVFSGDVLFRRAVGRTDFISGNARSLLHSIRNSLFVLPDDTVVYSGHGPDTTIGEEKRYNPVGYSG